MNYLSKERHLFLDYWDSRNVFFVARHMDNLRYSQIEERL